MKNKKTIPTKTQLRTSLRTLSLLLMTLLLPAGLLAQSSAYNYVQEQAKYLRDVLATLFTTFASSLDQGLIVATENISIQAPLLSLHEVFYLIANAGFVLGLVLVGILMIINSDRINALSLRKILPRFVTSVLLVNFGIFFMQFFTDIATILTKLSLSKIVLIANNVIKTNDYAPGIKIALTLFGIQSEQLLGNSQDTGLVSSLLLTTTSLIVGVGSLFIRNIALTFLIAFSPVAIFLWFIPPVATITKHWFKLFLVLTFSAPITGFLMLLGIDFGQRFADQAYSPITLLYGTSTLFLIPCIPYLLYKATSLVEMETLTENIKESFGSLALQNASHTPVSISPALSPQQKNLPQVSTSPRISAEIPGTSTSLGTSLVDGAGTIQDKIKLAAQSSVRRLPFGNSATVTNPAETTTINIENATLQTGTITLQQQIPPPKPNSDQLKPSPESLPTPSILTTTLPKESTKKTSQAPLLPPEEKILFTTKTEQQTRSTQAVLENLEAGLNIRTDEIESLLAIPEQRKQLTEKQLSTLIASSNEDKRNKIFAELDTKGYWSDAQQGTILGLAVQDRVRTAIKEGNVDWENTAVQQIALGAPLPDEPGQLTVALKSGQFKSLLPQEPEAYYTNATPKSKDVLLASLGVTDQQGSALWDTGQQATLEKLAASERIAEAKLHVQTLSAQEQENESTFRDEDLGTTGKLISLASIQETLQKKTPLPKAGDLKASILSGSLSSLSVDMLKDLYKEGDDKIRYVLTSTQNRSTLSGDPLWNTNQQQAILQAKADVRGTTSSLDETTPSPILDALLLQPELFRNALYDKSLPLSTPMLETLYKQAPEAIKEILVQSLDATTALGIPVWDSAEKEILQAVIRKGTDTSSTGTTPLPSQVPPEQPSLTLPSKLCNWLQNPQLQTLDFAGLAQAFGTLAPGERRDVLAFAGSKDNAPTLTPTTVIGLEYLAGMEALQNAKQQSTPVPTLPEVQQKLLQVAEQSPTLLENSSKQLLAQGNLRTIPSSDVQKLFAQSEKPTQTLLLASMDIKDQDGKEIWSPEQKNMLVATAGKNEMQSLAGQTKLSPPKIDALQQENKSGDSSSPQTSQAEQILGNNTKKQDIPGDTQEQDSLKNVLDGVAKDPTSQNQNSLAEEFSTNKKAQKQLVIADQVAVLEAGRTLLITPDGSITELDPGIIKRAEILFDPDVKDNITNFPFSLDDLIKIARKIKLYATKKLLIVSLAITDFLRIATGEE